MFARFGVGRAVFVGAFEVLEHELDGLQGEAVGKVVGEHGNVCFYGVGQYVQTGVGGYAGGNGHAKKETVYSWKGSAPSTITRSRS